MVYRSLWSLTTKVLQHVQRNFKTHCRILNTKLLKLDIAGVEPSLGNASVIVEEDGLMVYMLWGEIIFL